MTARETIQRYFRALSERAEWQQYFSDDIVFTIHSTPTRSVTGRVAVIDSTKGFYAMIENVEVRDLIVDGHRACAFTRYSLRPPGDDPFTSDVAELFTVEDDRIAAFEIFFDSAPYPA